MKKYLMFFFLIVLCRMAYAETEEELATKIEAYGNEQFQIIVEKAAKEQNYSELMTGQQLMNFFDEIKIQLGYYSNSISSENGKPIARVVDKWLSELRQKPYSLRATFLLAEILQVCSIDIAKGDLKNKLKYLSSTLGKHVDRLLEVEESYRNYMDYELHNGAGK